MTNPPSQQVMALPEDRRAEVLAIVSGVVEKGRAAIAHVECELSRVEHKVVAARTKLDDFRKAMDELEVAGDRVRGVTHG